MATFGQHLETLKLAFVCVGLPLGVIVGATVLWFPPTPQHVLVFLAEVFLFPIVVIPVSMGGTFGAFFFWPVSQQSELKDE